MSHEQGEIIPPTRIAGEPNQEALIDSLHRRGAYSDEEMQSIQAAAALKQFQVPAVPFAIRKLDTEMSPAAEILRAEVQQFDALSQQLTSAEQVVADKGRSVYSNILDSSPESLFDDATKVIALRKKAVATAESEIPQLRNQLSVYESVKAGYQGFIAAAEEGYLSSDEATVIAAAFRQRIMQTTQAPAAEDNLFMVASQEPSEEGAAGGDFTEKPRDLFEDLPIDQFGGNLKKILNLAIEGMTTQSPTREEVAVVTHGEKMQTGRSDMKRALGSLSANMSQINTRLGGYKSNIKVRSVKGRIVLVRSDKSGAG